MRVAFAGHRPAKLGNYVPNSEPEQRVRAALARYLSELLLDRPDLTAISGMAVGFDQWAAETCLSLGIPYTAAIPFEGFEKKWPLRVQQHYYELRRKAVDEVIVCPGDYRPYKMQKRNEWMVDNCALLVAAWDGSDGGTANCVRYAWKVDRPVKKLEW